MDQGGAGISTIQLTRFAEGAGRLGPGLPGVEHQTDAGASGGLMNVTQPNHAVDRGPIQDSMGCQTSNPRSKVRNLLH